MSDRKRRGAVGPRHRDVVFWYAALNPYMAERFSALARMNSVDFECWIVRDTNPARAWHVPDGSRAFPYRKVPGIDVGAHRIGLPLRELFAVHPRVLVTFHGDPAVALSVLQRLHPRCKLVYYVEKTFDTWTTRHWAKEALKRLLFSGRVWFMTPGTDADDYLAEYGVPRDRISRLEHAVDYHHLSRAREIGGGARDAVRMRLGVRGFVFLYLGRIWSEKGVWTLLDAHERLLAAGRDATVLMVGDGIDRNRFAREAESRGVAHIVMHDFVQHDQLPEILAAADALVFPTRGDPYGLVVDEAMAAGLPVVSSTSAGEIRGRVIDARNGYLVRPDDSDALAAAMTKLLSDPEHARRMGAAGSAMIESHTPDRWARQATAALHGLVG